MPAHRHPLIALAWKWGPVIFWMALIFFMSAQSVLPGVEDTWLDLLIKKGGHFTAYAILAGLVWRALAPAPHNVRLMCLVWAIACLYAVSDEVHQLFVPGRHGTPIDVVIDSAGALSAVLLLRWLARRSVGNSSSLM